ncbi:MAG: TetR/AcrR family transcriptional regulator [Pseudomonadota bacterium]
MTETSIIDLAEVSEAKQAPQPPRSRGRPPALCPEKRRDMILDAMERVLGTKGLRGATMAAIAAEARMSKRTLYEVFGDRDSLFSACVRRIRASFLHSLDDAERALPLADRLRLLFTPSIGYTDPPKAILRAVISEAPAQPELARRFLREGPFALREAIRSELDRAVAQGEVAISDTQSAAAILCRMACDSPIDKLIDPDLRQPSEAEIDARLREAIRVFLQGIGAQGGTQ